MSTSASPVGFYFAFSPCLRKSLMMPQDSLLPQHRHRTSGKLPSTAARSARAWSNRNSGSVGEDRGLRASGSWDFGRSSLSRGVLHSCPLRSMRLYAEFISLGRAYAHHPPTLAYELLHPSLRLMHLSEIPVPTL